MAGSAMQVHRSSELMESALFQNGLMTIFFSESKKNLFNSTIQHGKSGHKKSQSAEAKCIKEAESGFRELKIAMISLMNMMRTWQHQVMIFLSSSLTQMKTEYSTYVLKNIDHVSDLLGIPWKKAKDVPFSESVPYIQFVWDIGE